MPRLAALFLLLAASAAQAQPATSPPAPQERWFAIAMVRGNQQHLGPFPSLNACEEGRTKGAREAQSRIDELRVEYGLDRLHPFKDEQKFREATRLWLDRCAELGLSEKRAQGEFWRDQAICERK